MRRIQTIPLCALDRIPVAPISIPNLPFYGDFLYTYVHDNTIFVTFLYDPSDPPSKDPSLLSLIPNDDSDPTPHVPSDFNLDELASDSYIPGLILSGTTSYSLFVAQ